MPLNICSELRTSKVTMMQTYLKPTNRGIKLDLNITPYGVSRDLIQSLYSGRYITILRTNGGYSDSIVIIYQNVK